MGRNIRAVLKDLDGVLVDSEPLVHRASTPLVNEVLRAKGVGRQYEPDELRDAFVGLGFSKIIAALGREHDFAVGGEELTGLMARELDLVVAILEAEVEATPGAEDMLSQVHAWGLERAVISSSELRRIHACMRRTGFYRYIPWENLFSACDSLPKPEGKPSGKVYEVGRLALGVSADECVAVEDSLSGILAARAAGIEVLGFLGAEKSARKREQLARVLLEAGAAAVFDNWTGVLEWIRP